MMNMICNLFVTAASIVFISNETGILTSKMFRETIANVKSYFSNGVSNQSDVSTQTENQTEMNEENKDYTLLFN
jgi:hypothetical protein